MLMPKKVKYRKRQKGRNRRIAWRGSKISFGKYALQTLEPGYISDRQIEAARIAITRHVKRGGQVWIRVFPDKPLSKKPAEVRMGKGKGSPERWVARVRQGRILFELDGVSPEIAKEAMSRAAHKLPVATRYLNKDDRSFVI
ncbi:LSU ribosomal protein L16p (L10e) [hydrothermal vent metagenome]|uniref:LSU ribosomal protein L16p (L10e) n=1 Tax=hydrothermal vent metagenome TaxID=652676 RepID=A0A3B1C8M1_9ZZZZ